MPLEKDLIARILSHANAEAADSATSQALGASGEAQR